MSIQFNLAVIMAQYRQRTGQRLTYRFLAQETGINKNSLHAIASNQAVRADLRTLEVLCKFFDCRVSDLLIHVPDIDERAERVNEKSERVLMPA